MERYKVIGSLFITLFFKIIISLFEYNCLSSIAFETPIINITDVKQTRYNGCCKDNEIILYITRRIP